MDAKIGKKGGTCKPGGNGLYEVSSSFGIRLAVCFLTLVLSTDSESLFFLWGLAVILFCIGPLCGGF